MKNNGKSFEITILAILAGVNAVIELTLGNYLHYVKFPLVGSIMVGINVIIYTAGYTLVPRRGSIITMGFITALLNLFFGGSFKPWSILAIFMESAIIELIISSLGLKFRSVFLASLLSNLFSLGYTMTVFSLIMGRGVLETLIATFTRIVGNPELVKNSLVTAGILVILIHFINSLIFSWLAWKLKSIAGILARRRYGIREME